jgi:hypothetical protein
MFHRKGDDAMDLGSSRRRIRNATIVGAAVAVLVVGGASPAIADTTTEKDPVTNAISTDPPQGETPKLGPQLHSAVVTAKADSTLSNILKKWSDTAHGIISNFK